LEVAECISSLITLIPNWKMTGSRFNLRRISYIYILGMIYYFTLGKTKLYISTSYWIKIQNIFSDGRKNGISPENLRCMICCKHEALGILLGVENLPCIFFWAFLFSRHLIQISVYCLDFVVWIPFMWKIHTLKVSITLSFSWNSKVVGKRVITDYCYNQTLTSLG
jgi:hypothetical protein